MAAKSSKETMVEPVLAAEKQEVVEAVVTLWDVFGTDPQLEKEGVWIDLGKYGKFLLARAGGANRSFQAAVEVAMRPHRALIEAGKLDEDLAEQLLIPVFAKTIVRGWEAVRNKPPMKGFLEFNQENAAWLLTELPELFRRLKKEADTIQLFLAHQGEDEAKS